MKRIEPTIVEKAIQTVDGFSKVYKGLQQQIMLRGQSKSTLENYIRRIALISLHYGHLPEALPEMPGSQAGVLGRGPDERCLRGKVFSCSVHGSP
ncbi:MAG: hypothetical protein ABIJ04_06995 [Bacteroidota bacterium]